APRIRDLALVNLLKSLYFLGVPPQTKELRSAELELRWRLRGLSYRRLASLATYLAGHRPEGGGQEPHELLAELWAQLEMRWAEIEDAPTIAMLLARQDCLSPQLRDRLEDKGLELAAHFSPADIRRIAVALAQRNHRSLPLLRAISYHFVQKHFAVPPDVLLDLAFAFGKLNFHQTQMFQKICADLLPHLSDLPPTDVVRCVKSFSYLKWLNLPFFEASAEIKVETGVVVKDLLIKVETRVMVKDLQIKVETRVVVKDLQIKVETRVVVKDLQIKVETRVVVKDLQIKVEMRVVVNDLQIKIETRVVVKVLQIKVEMRGVVKDLQIKSHHILDGQLSSLNPSLLVDLVWSLCVLQQAEAVHFQSVLLPKFYSGFFGNWTPARQNTWLKLMHINTTAQLESPGYAGPFLPSDKLGLQDLGVTRTPTSLQTDVNAVLAKLAGEEAKLRFNVDTPYGWKLDAEMVLDSENNPLPVDSSVHQPSVEAGGRRLAFLLWEFPNFSSRSKDLLGRFVMARRHIQTAGYVVVEIPYHEWFNLNTDWKKTQYLKDKIQKSVTKDLAE
ncbi:FAST kinase domain-containing protein 4, partial [Protobothrops mucrosquamatus]|uniref:FAST kinase domain-containing protein 4 n=1 Tax=Protobothrops mucrosquamatus TaxID=103944 RepID=UPI000775624B